MSHKILAAVCAGIVVAAVSAQTTPPPPPIATGLIVGQVVDAVTGRGIADVAVTPTLFRDVSPGGSFARAILTDAEGRFVLRDLPAGSYQLTARRSGYVESSYGAGLPGGESKPLILQEGGRVGDAKIRLWKFAAVGGTIVDEAGDPIVGLQVHALKRTLTAGRWRLGEYYSNIKYRGRTDDRGVYRISDLEPGEYIVSVPLTSAVAPASAVAELEALRLDPASRAAYTAAADAFNASGVPVLGPGSSRSVAVGDFVALALPGLAPATSANGPLFVYQTQFFPGVTTASGAQQIAIKAGEERGGIDFAMKPVRTWRVSGSLTGPAGPAPGLALRLVQNDGDSVLDETDVATTVSGANGAFTFLGVPQGHYVLRVLRVGRLPQATTQVGSVTRTEQAAGSSSEPTLWANLPVSVGDADITDVAVSLSTGVRASGRVVFDGAAAKPTPAQLAALEITFDLADGRRPSRYGDDRIRLTDETFATPELAPGKYVVRTRSVPPWTMKSAKAGDREVSDVPLVVDGREIPPITITFTDRPGASLSGTVRASGNVAVDATVFLYPVERSAWVDYGSAPRRLRRAQVAKTGVYTITPVPRGDYFVVALADDRTPDWRDPKHLEALAKVAARVTMADDEAKSLDLKVERVQAAATAAASAPLRAVHADESADDTRTRPSGPFVGDDDGLQQPARDGVRAAPAPPPTGTAVITGVVVTDDAGASPVRRAVVILNCTDPKVGRTAVTDDAGRFVLSALPAGRYRLNVTKPGYVDTSYGATKPGRPATPITLAADQRATVRVPVLRGAVITGVIRDSRGGPLRGVYVNVSQYDLSGGDRRLASAGRSQEPSDERGQYRVFGLEPGEYFVNAERPNVGFYRSLRQTTAEDLAAAERELRSTGAMTAAPPVAVAPPAPPPDMGYAIAFYPGTPLFSQATALTLKAGEERSGVDIVVPLLALAHISAHVVGPDGQPPAMVQARLVPLIQVPGLSQTGLDAGMFVPVADGNVRILGIPPGEYVLHVGGSSTPAPPPASSGGIAYSPTTTLGLPMWAMLPLTIDGRDIDGLNVRLEPAKRVQGRVVFEGAAPAPNLPPAQVWLRGPQLGGVTLGGVSKRASATPAFVLDGIVPASYRVVTENVRGWMLKSAIVNGRDASDLPADISTDVADVVVTLTDKLTELSGVLQTPAGTPAPNYYIIVFPKDPAYWLNGSRRIVSLRPATDGRFVTAATSPLPPGDYLIAALTDVRSGEWFDPEFLTSLTAAAIPVTIAEGEKRQDIQIR